MTDKKEEKKPGVYLSDTHLWPEGAPRSDLRYYKGFFYNDEGLARSRSFRGRVRFQKEEGKGMTGSNDSEKISAEIRE